MGDIKDIQTDGQAKLLELKAKLIDVLEELNKIRPVQFVDFESAYIYNFLGISERPVDDRIYIHISGEYDNLPSHANAPLRNSRNRAYLPLNVDGIL